MIPAGTYTIERDHSELGFNVRHAGIAKVRGKFTEYDGTIVIAEDITQSSAEVTMKTASIFTGSEARDNHLRSADFFDAENKPTVTFRSAEVRVNDDDEFVLAGELTLNGVTRPVVLDVEYNGAATDPFGYQRVGFEAKTRVNRKDFGLTWNAALETGGVLVSDQVTIQLEVSAVKQA
jgi:polyisoprenoid-binding protein YceI